MRSGESKRHCQKECMVSHPDDFPVDVLHLSPRWLCSVKRASLRTVGDLLSLQERRRIDSIRNIGAKGRAEIERALVAFRTGEHLLPTTGDGGQHSRSVQPPRDDAVPGDEERQIAMETLPLSALALRPETRTALDRAEIHTVGQLMNLEREGLLRLVRGIGESRLAVIRQKLSSLDETISSASAATVRGSGALCEPIAGTPHNPEPVHLLAHFSDIVDRGMSIVGNERDREIIYRHYGLADGRRVTLEEIGRLLGITRERVRQLLARALVRLRKVLHEAHSPQYCCFPADLVNEARQLEAFINAESFRSEREILTWFEDRYGRPVAPAEARHLPPLMHTLGASSVRLLALHNRSPEVRLWLAAPLITRRRMARSANAVRSLIRGNPRGVPLAELTALVVRDTGQYVSVDEVQRIAALLPGVEITPDGDVRRVLDLLSPPLEKPKGPLRKEAGRSASARLPAG